MQEKHALQNTKCYFGEQFSEQAKDCLRNEVCKDLTVEHNHDGKSYCVLHFPNILKLENTNFTEVVKQRIETQENNFCGVYFPGNTDLNNHIFETDTNFEHSLFEEANFFKTKFNEKVSFSFSNLKKANFQSSVFHKISFFIQTIFATDSYQTDEHLAIDFSNANFIDAVFQRSIFNKIVHFNGVIFQSANFLETVFKNGASFFSTKFLETASFSKANFQGSTEFNNSIFDSDETAKATKTNKAFIITTDFSDTVFEDVIFTKTVFESVLFEKAIFNGIQVWNSTFNSYVSFESATFHKTNFFKVKFFYEANFEKVVFQDKAVFSDSAFFDEAKFYSATFENESNVVFIDTSFKALVDLQAIKLKGYLAFEGSLKNSVFIEPKVCLTLQYLKTDKPDKLSFHTLKLHPSWFVNCDSRKFVFHDIDWKNADGNNKNTNIELESVQEREITGRIHRLLTISCRQLATNYEESNHYEQASNFRRMSMELTFWEKRIEQKKWWTYPFKAFNIWGETRKRYKSRWKKVYKRWKDRNRPHLRFIQAFDLPHYIYRLLSYYGESWLRAFILLSTIVFSSAFLYWISWSEFLVESGVKSLGFFEAIFYSLRVMILQRPEPFPNNIFAKGVLAVESVLAPLQLALLALAIRRKFMR